MSGITKMAKQVRFYSKVDLVILDELGYLPFSQAGGALLLQLLSRLYEHTSLITTNLRMVQGVRRREDDHSLA